MVKGCGSEGQVPIATKTIGLIEVNGQEERLGGARNCKWRLRGGVERT